MSIAESANRSGAEQAYWNPSSSPLILQQRLNQTADTVSFVFTNADKLPFQFKPGQFATLTINIDGKAYHRAYSISSVPEQQQLQLTIKRVPGGLVSNWLIDNLLPGQQINTTSIAGEFNSVDCAHGNKLLFISAGCGITPVMSMARTLLQASSDHDICFLHCARDMNNIIFAKEMKQLATQHPTFKPRLLLEDAANSTEAEGLISLPMLEQLCPDFRQRSLFLCGPTGFMEACKSIVESAAYDMSQFYQESFTPAANDSQRGNSDADTLVQISVPKLKLKLAANAGSTLLTALEDNEVPIIAACRSGVCGSCKCKITAGEVVSTSQGALSNEEVAQGFVLACSSTLMSDTEIELA
ncbi:NADH oxidoreductase Hcr [Sinobacterium caligoides]|uniref:NADH oxidoreductase Hcr n=1 Tax=Sinobacterium caligoides TaxID=933926 RepID=A0A3N2DZZ3_9GAMM|nr:hybrid-cluster NAD(P)-dependent oxidoreductase [Sinobacterium caligoides]ROS05410.1 NADH oxidoreductase Hcr [Sinobacterium caligoides]